MYSHPLFTVKDLSGNQPKDQRREDFFYLQLLSHWEIREWHASNGVMSGSKVFHLRFSLN